MQRVVDNDTERISQSTTQQAIPPTKRRKSTHEAVPRHHSPNKRIEYSRMCTTATSAGTATIHRRVKQAMSQMLTQEFLCHTLDARGKGKSSLDRACGRALNRTFVLPRPENRPITVILA